MLADLLGKPLTGVTSFPTVRDPKALVQTLATRIKALLAEHPDVGACEGIGVVVPGMVEHSTMTRAARADARLAQRQSARRRSPPPPASRCRSRTPAAPVRWRRCGRCAATRHGAGGDLVFVSVSDGVGVGVIINGEVLRGRHNIAGEFGHVPLSLDGPRCSCGSNGCWEAYVSNRATLARYFGRPARADRPRDVDPRALHDRRPDRAGARRRRQGRRRDRGHGPLSRSRAWRRSSTRSIRRASTSAAKSRRRGI